MGRVSAAPANAVTAPIVRMASSPADERVTAQGGAVGRDADARADLQHHAVHAGGDAQLPLADFVDSEAPVRGCHSAGESGDKHPREQVQPGRVGWEPAQGAVSPFRVCTTMLHDYERDERARCGSETGENPASSPSMFLAEKQPQYKESQRDRRQ